VDFVSPKSLGDIQDFRNRYVQPILAGMMVDSTEAERRLSKRKLWVRLILILLIP
jgi:hypothetical protein